MVQDCRVYREDMAINLLLRKPGTQCSQLRRGRKQWGTFGLQICTVNKRLVP